MRNNYSIGNIFFAGLETNERLSFGRPGHITIGGDRGDVLATSALNHENDECEEGVLLADITLFTTLELADNEVEDEVREIVQAYYDSIQGEAFSQSKRITT